MSDDLRAALASELERYRPEGRPVVAELEVRRRRRSRRRQGAAALAIALGAAAIAVPTLSSVDPGSHSLGAPGAVVDGQTRTIDGIRTTADGLLVSYLGGSCDGPARLAVKEGPDRVDVDVVVGPDPRAARGEAGLFCDAAGHVRNVSGTLTTPLGERKVFNGGQQVIVFDGDRVLVPTDLPAGTVFSREGGGSDRQPEAAVVTTTSWGSTYAAPRAKDPRRCTPGPAAWDVSQGPAVETAVTDPAYTEVGTRQVGDASARLYRGTFHTGEPLGWRLVWQAAGGNVMLSTLGLCQGDSFPTEAEVLAFARSLRPAS